MDIIKGFGNANKMMNRVLYALTDTISIAEIDGGSLRNAIPRESNAIITTNDTTAFKSAFDKVVSEIQKEYKTVESDLEIIAIADELRKDVNERKRLINEADCVILCLPDDASKEAASMVENDNTVVIDASTAFRVDDEWTYGFPELSKSQKNSLKSSKRISNPGCYPTGFIALVKPLVDAGIIPEDAPLTVNAVSGYSGGGNALIGIYESEDDHEPWGAYGYSMNHKHLPGK